MKKITIVIHFLMLFAIITTAQQENIVSNTQVIDEDRYKDIKGTPYIFEEWKTASVTDYAGDVYNDILLNYNGHKESFEVRKNGRYATLANNNYLMVEIVDADGEKIIFKRLLHEKFRGRFAMVLYQSKKVHFINWIYTHLNEDTVQDVGQTREFKRFIKRNRYYILKEGELIPIKLKKKSIYEALGKKKILEAYAKKQKLKLKTEADLIALLQFYEKL